mgnify:CR=1 FL=1
MAEYKMGFIGTGNMGSALARAAAKSGERMLLANRTPEKAEALAAVLGAKVGTNLQAAAACEYIFLGVKPQMLPALLDELRPALQSRTDRFILVSMAAGVKTGTIRQALGFDCPVVRIMPNLPVARVMWRAMPDLTTGVECWITAGGAHHTVLSYDVTAEQLRDWARMMEIEFVHITKDTTVESLEHELFLNDLAWKLK